MTTVRVLGHCLICSEESADSPSAASEALVQCQYIEKANIIIMKKDRILPWGPTLMRFKGPYNLRITTQFGIADAELI